MDHDTAGYAHRLDVRAIDGPPFADIMAALDDLAEGETLLLVNGFEPEPLYAIVEGRGLAYETTRVADDEWQVAITNG